jgi:hypothetical protein
MRVIREAYVLEELTDSSGNSFLLAQGTTLPKMFVSEATANAGAKYWGKHYNNGTVIHKAKKVFLVVEDKEIDDAEIPF